MDILIIVISVVALIVAFLAKIKTGDLDERLLDISSTSYRTIDKLEGEIEELQKTVKSLQFQQIKEKGGSVFTKDMMISKAVIMHPEAQTVFASFHLGGCSSCAVSDEESIEEGAKAHGVELSKLLEALNKLG